MTLPVAKDRQREKKKDVRDPTTETCTFGLQSDLFFFRLDADTALSSHRRNLQSEEEKKNTKK